jgi:hypothetical protein
MVFPLDFPDEPSLKIPSASHVKWEYSEFRIHSLGEEIQEKIAQGGEDGWELVSVVNLSDDSGIDLIYYFKRPRLD